MATVDEETRVVESEPSCVHDWKVLAKTRAPALPVYGSMEGPANTIRAQVQGTTSFLLACSKCGSTKTHELFGEAVNP